jgi:endonuclease YncB( thermonuclease family)
MIAQGAFGHAAEPTWAIPAGTFPKLHRAGLGGRLRLPKTIDGDTTMGATGEAKGPPPTVALGRGAKVIVACAAGLLGTLVAAAAPDGRTAEVVDGLATVQGDGSLRVGGQTVRLYGAYLPDTDPACRSLTRSGRCSSRAVRALQGKVSGFVRCGIVRRNGGVLEGTCTVPGPADRLGAGEDLAAWLIEGGWAMAAPGAPGRYFALEALAHSRGAGLWNDGLRRGYR